MFGFCCWLVGVFFYTVIGMAIFSVSPVLFFIVAVCVVVHAFLTAGPLTNKARHAARRRRNELQMLLSEID